MCRIVTGSSRPFKAQMSYTYQLGDRGELLVVVTARDVSISAVSFRYIKIVMFFLSVFVTLWNYEVCDNGHAV